MLTVALWIGGFVFGRPLAVVSRWMKPSTPRSPHIESVQASRAWLGFAGLTTLLVANKADKDLPNVLSSLIEAPFAKVVVAAPSFLVAGVVLVVLSSRENRPAMAWRVAKPWLTAMAIAGVPLAILLIASNELRAPAVRTSPNTQMGVLLVVMLVLPMLPAAFWGQVLGVRYGFRAPDVHPLMPALLGSTIAAVTLIKSVVDILGGGTDLDLYLGWFGIGGSLGVAALSAYEYAFLRKLGYHWRTVPAVLVGPAVRTKEWLPWVAVPAIALLMAPSLGPVESSASTHLGPPGLIAAPPSQRSAVRQPATTGSRVPAPHVELVTVRLIRVRADGSAPAGRDGGNHPVSYSPMKVADGRKDTAWRVAGGGRHQLVLYFGRRIRISSVALIPGYDKRDEVTGQDWFLANRRINEAQWHVGTQTPVVQLFKDARSLQSLSVRFPPTSSITLTITGTHGGTAAHNFTAISEVVVRGVALP